MIIIYGLWGRKETSCYCIIDIKKVAVKRNLIIKEPKCFCGEKILLIYNVYKDFKLLTEMHRITTDESYELCVSFFEKHWTFEIQFNLK